MRIHSPATPPRWVNNDPIFVRYISEIGWNNVFFFVDIPVTEEVIETYSAVYTVAVFVFLILTWDDFLNQAVSDVRS